MPRDAKIKEIFEVADDGLQGVMGYFFYVLGCKKSVDTNSLVSVLPDKAILITHEWIRYYNPQELINSMDFLFDPYHARICLISAISIFEGALKNFLLRLIETQKIKKFKLDNYKTRLK